MPMLQQRGQPHALRCYVGLAGPSREQLRTGRREFHIGAGTIQRQPAAIYRQIETGLVFGRAGLVLIQKRRVDQLDIDAAVLHRLDRVCDLDQLAGSLFRVGVRAISANFIRLFPVGSGFRRPGNSIRLQNC
jgi:hypothetical protein